MSKTHKYTMNISLNVLNHLGINLYSNIPAVLSEIIANAWDADAENVDITVDHEKRIITILDDGFGMDINDINEKFLHVGYSKRTDAKGFQKTPKHTRDVMGRKGIGKLSMFSIADNIVITTKKNASLNAFELNAEKIKTAIEKDNGEYHPEDVEAVDFGYQSGTKIVLSHLKKNISSATTEFLKKRVSRRFSIIGEHYKFQVKANGEPIKVTDRDYFHKLQYLWYFGDEGKEYEALCTNKEHSEQFNNELIVGEGKDQKKYMIKGWLGLVKHSGELQDGDENLNKIVIMVRDKLAQEDILEEFREGGMYTKFLFGEIHADFLDLDDYDDIATSSRQKIIEDDPRYLALKTFIQSFLKQIELKRAKYKEDDGERDALRYPSIKAWFNELKGDTKKKAKKLFGKINQIATDEEHQKQLFKHGILAFESLRTREALDSLETVNIKDLVGYMSVFHEFDDIEKTLFHEITSGRIKIIHKLKENVDDNVLEKVLQDYLYDHLWLLDPSWDRIPENTLLEQSVTTAFNTISKDISKDEASGRVDIRYVKTSGTHVIVELKRATVSVTSNALRDQVGKYMRGLRKQLETVGRGKEPINAVCILGKEPSDWKDMDQAEKNRSLESARIENISFMTYQQLIHDSYETYKQYIDSSKQQGKILNLIKSIEDELTND